MSKLRLLPYIAIGLTASLLMSSCSSDDASSIKRTRRSQTASETTTTKPLQTSTTLPVQETTPIAAVAFLNADQIAQTWTQANLCGLVPVETAQSILKMTTAPVPAYSFSQESGARCTFATGSGDEMSIEISTSSFMDARTVDTALQTQTEAIVVNGVGGVKKSNKSTGVSYFLNISGGASNQWIVNAPKDSQTNELAKVLISSLT